LPDWFPNFVRCIAGSIAFICQPIGSLISGLIVEFFGRKWSMVLVNIPFLAGWLLYCFSTSITMLFTANIILGMGIGFMEAPIMTYLGETCQPQVRALITSFPGVYSFFDYFQVPVISTL
jgi:SP family facilitated glucose transporter-like MFS transporter 8